MNNTAHHHTKNAEVLNKKINFLSHQDYTTRVLQYFRNSSKRDADYFQEYYEPLLNVFLLNLDPISGLLSSLYSPDKRGGEIIDPGAMFRSLLLMTAFGEKSPRKWSVKVKLEPILFLFSGFQPDREAPCYVSYYNFKKRLENGPYQKRCVHIVLPSEMRRAATPDLRDPPPKPTGNGEKTKRSPKGVLERLLKDLQAAQGQPSPEDLESRLNEILMEIAVKPSAKKRLLGDESKVTIAGDGSTIPSGANTYGQPTCECHKQGIYKCDHPRLYSDPDAQWGWDNREKDYVFGYRFYQIVCGTEGHDLPLYLSIASANAHEGGMFLKGMDRFVKQNVKLFPNLKIHKIALDSIHDAHAIYQYLYEQRILPAIPYAKDPGKCIFLGDEKQPFNDKGVPLCKEGVPMRLHGTSKQGHQVYCCPVKRAARKEGKIHYAAYPEECPAKALCDPSSPLGPYVRVRKDLDLRIHPELPRGSEEYKKLLASRTTTERSNSAKKEFYQLKYTKTRVMAYAHIRLILASILEHSRAWVKEMFKDEKKPKEKALAFIRGEGVP